MNIKEAQIKFIKMKKKIGKRNFKLIEVYANSTIKTKTEVIKSSKGKKLTIKRWLELCEIYLEIKDAFHQESLKKIKITSNGFQTIAERRHQLINSGKLGIEYARKERMRIVEDVIEDNVSISGNIYVNVSFTVDPAKVDYDSYTEKGEQYNSQCTYRKNNLKISVTMPNNWYSRVYKNDFTYIDGLMTLDISTPLKINTDSDLSVRAAKWLAKSKGSSFKVVDGFIAFKGDKTFHAKTLPSAIKGIERKSLMANITKLPKNKIIELAKKSKALVRLTDSYFCGNCKWGTLDFCRRNNISLEGKSPFIPLCELAVIAKKEPRQEVLSVMAYKLKIEKLNKLNSNSLAIN